MMRQLLIYSLWLISTCLWGQSATLLILDEMKQPVSYAAVVNEAGNVLEYSADDGRVTFDLSCESDKYTINYFGYVDQEIVLSCREKHDMTISLKPDVISLKTINIVGTSMADQADKPYEISTINKQTLRQFQSQTTVDALEQNGGAYIQRSQMGGGSPILRGFEANKVLLVVDGIRMNNAIYRSGHLQNAISVDQAILDNITTLYGPGSIIYGSDALGGVVHFQTLRPRFSTIAKPAFSGGYYARYASANQEKSGHVHLQIAGQKLASLTSISYADFDDLISGSNYPDRYPNFGKRPLYVDPDTDEIITNDNPEKQLFTGYNQLDLLQKLTYKIDAKKYVSLNVQYSTTSDIPRFDELTVVDENNNPETAEWYYGPQKRFLSAIRFDNETNTKFFNRYQLQIAYQKINEDRHQRAWQIPDLISNFEEVDVYGGTLDFFKKLDKHDEQELSYGIEYRYNIVLSEAQRLNKETGIVNTNVFTRYPSDNSEMFDGGLYALYQFKKERFTAQAGGRINWNKIYVRYSRDDFFNWPEYFYKGISQSNTSVTWLAGFNYRLAPRTHVRLFTGSGFRAPNVDDFGKVRVRAASSISIPNAELSPEKTWNIELGVHQTILDSDGSTPQVHVGVTGYFTSIADAIIRQNSALPNGDSTYFFDENDLQVQANVNAANGHIVGLSAQTQAIISEYFELSASLSWQRGRSKIDGVTQPLAHIPPLYGQFTAKYNRGRWGMSYKSVFNGKKKLSDFAPGSSDNEDLATPEGSLAWSIFNLYANYQITDRFEIKTGVENIFDIHYRTFSSGISAPGRNVKVGVYGRF